MLAASGIAVSAVGLQGTAEIAARLDDPTGAAALTWVALLAAASLGLLGWSAASTIALSQDPLHRVFRCGPAFRCGAVLSLIALASTASLIARDPFAPLIARFRVTAVDVADAGFVLGIVICLTAAGAAFVDAWDLRQEERRWPESAHTE